MISNFHLGDNEHVRNDLCYFSICTDICVDSGFQYVVWGSQGMHGKFPWDSWIHLFNGYFEGQFFFFQIKVKFFK
jgi:hypothetical protein